ncbi:dihydrofolate reductase family protein [Ornithinimicrobium sp. F0845]|uniref:dihydrofolate reductase family protein n=1 Tax=Ornithinimicrobium sp. F0845 TaxID=2926412 RepID=UPI001FF180C1|nr:dihydrofolate reductase family protein [Ornithinimicrobium sp. F0845]MCK0111875.1 dihydrofolate reductase family protein [Ornithinimicrobium sp. F0845]
MVSMSTGQVSLEELLRQYAVGPGPLVRANFVTTLDGHATGGDGLSGSINSAADKQVFDVLRALADVVVVGAGTIRAEGYGRLRTQDPELLRLRRDAGRSDHPVLAVVTASGELPEKVLAQEPGAGDLLVLCAEAVAADLTERLGAEAVLVCGDDVVEATRALEALHARGLNQVLTEGGPHLLGGWLQAGVVDELCLTLRPVVLGGTGPRIVEAASGTGALARFELHHVLEIDGDLMLRYVAAS